MRASELIKKLEELTGSHGDPEVCVYGFGGECQKVREIELDVKLMLCERGVRAVCLDSQQRRTGAQR